MKQIVTLIRPYILPVGLYGAVIALVFGRALIPGATEIIWGDDIHRSYYFYRQFFNNFLSQGVWPWWNPYNFAGSPFMANPIVNMLYPGSWLFVLLPLNIAYSWHIAIHIFWAMLGMYILLKHIIGQIGPDWSDWSGLSSWFAGLVFGLSGFFTARIWAGHVDVIAAASWMPWVVAAFTQLMRAEVGMPSFSYHQGPRLPSSHQSFFAKAVMMLETSRLPARDIMLAGLVLAMQLFAGYQTMAMLTLEAVGIMTVISLVTRRANTKTVVTVILSISLSVLLAIGLFAVVLLPQQEFFRQSIRTYPLPYFWNAYGSLTWQSLGQFMNPFFFGDQLTYAGPPPNFAEHAFFVGRGTLVLLMVTLIVWFVGKIRWFNPTNPTNNPIRPMNKLMKQWSNEAIWVVAFFLIALFGLWVSMGPNAPIDLQYILWKAIPMYHFLRIPPRHLILVSFGLSGLIGIAVTYLSVFLSSSGLTRGSSFRKTLDSRFRGNDTLQLFPILFAVLITTEMILYVRHFIVLRPIPETRHDPELIKILASDTGNQAIKPYRVLTNFGAWAPPRDSFDFDAGMNYGVFNATGYDTMILRPYYEFIDASNGKTSPSILEHDVQIPYLNVFSKATDLLNIKYILHPRGYDPLFGTKDPRFRLIREDVVRDYRLYENTTVLPRFYFADNKEGRVEIEKYSPNEIILSTQSTVGATLMSSEMYYPGWEGFVDGNKVDVIKVNNTFRALFVPAGPHTVLYRYNPRIFAIGGVITLITVGIMVFLWKKSYDAGASV
ncbi:MAG: YfhO family protein [Patescibacteria group bacterium]